MSRSTAASLITSAARYDLGVVVIHFRLPQWHVTFLGTANLDLARADYYRNRSQNWNIVSNTLSLKAIS